MYFIDKTKEKYWLLRKKEILEECRNQVVSISDVEIVLGNDGIFSADEYIVFFGKELLAHPTFNEDEGLREATKKELIEKGIYALHDTDIIVGDDIKSIYDFMIPESIAVPKFDYENLEWIEGGTDEDIEAHMAKLQEKEYIKAMPLTVYDMDNRLYMTQEMLDMLAFEMMSVQKFAMKTMTIEKQEEYMTTQAMYYYDRIVQKERREGFEAAKKYYDLVVSKFPQYKEDVDFLLIENDKEYFI